MKLRLFPAVVTLCVMFGTACDLDSALPEPITPTVRAVTATSTVEATAAPAPLPPDFDATIQAVTQALGGSNVSGLSAWLAHDVALAPRLSGLSSETLTREAALAWLNARWDGRHTVLENQFVEHFVAIVLVTDGWARIAPMENGVLELHLHRYNAQGQGDPLGGDWRIDTVLYQ